MAKRRRIVNPHHYISDLEAVYYPWLVDKQPSDFMAASPELAKNYLVPDYLAKTSTDTTRFPLFSMMSETCIYSLPSKSPCSPVDLPDMQQRAIG